MTKKISSFVLSIIASTAVHASAESVQIVPEPGQSTCFKRVYSEKHLQKNPNQRVTAMSLKIFVSKNSPGETYNNIKATLKGDEGNWSWGSGGACMSGVMSSGNMVPLSSTSKEFQCVLDGDSGGFGVSVVRTEPDSILVKSNGFMRLDYNYSGDDDFATTSLDPASDGVFKLYKVNATDCE